MRLRVRSGFTETDLPHINFGEGFDENLLSQLRLRDLMTNSINT